MSRSETVHHIFERGPDYMAFPDLLQITFGLNDVQASAIVQEYDIQSLSRASPDVLTRIPGIGPVTAARIVAAFEIARQLESYAAEDRAKVSSPAAVYNRLYPRMRGTLKERLVALYLDTKNRIIREEVVSVGSLNANIVHPREVFKRAIELSAASLIVAHNHPSGDPTPSREDIAVTEKLVQGGKLLGIDVLDHVIIGDNRYVSLKDEGLM